MDRDSALEYGGLFNYACRKPCNRLRNRLFTGRFDMNVNRIELNLSRQSIQIVVKMKSLIWIVLVPQKRRIRSRSVLGNDFSSTPLDLTAISE